MAVAVINVINEQIEILRKTKRNQHQDQFNQ